MKMLLCVILCRDLIKDIKQRYLIKIPKKDRFVADSINPGFQLDLYFSDM